MVIGKTAANPKPTAVAAPAIHFDWYEKTRTNIDKHATNKPTNATRRSDTRLNTNGATPRPATNPPQKNDDAKTHPVPARSPGNRLNRVAIHPPTDASIAT